MKRRPRCASCAQKNEPSKQNFNILLYVQQNNPFYYECLLLQTRLCSYCTVASRRCPILKEISFERKMSSSLKASVCRIVGRMEITRLSVARTKVIRGAKSIYCSLMEASCALDGNLITFIFAPVDRHNEQNWTRFSLFIRSCKAQSSTRKIMQT